MPTSESHRVVAVPFPYAERAGTKRRPAVVVSNAALAEVHGLAWVVMVTSLTNRRWPNDIEIEDRALAGLPRPSVIRPVKIATVELQLVEVIGRLDVGTVALLRRALGRFLTVSPTRP